MKASSLNFRDGLEQSVIDRTFLLLVLSKPRTTDTSSQATKLTIRPLVLRDELHYQKTETVGPQEFHQNLSAADLLAFLEREFPARFANAHLFTSEFDLAARFDPSSNDVRTKRSKPSRQPQPATHNREKPYLIPEGSPCPFLQAAGVMTRDGQVRAALYHKFRQINRYLEMIRDIVPHLPDSDPIRVVDFGCGKSYLTFAVHHYLTAILGRAVEITGLDWKSKVVADCNRIAGDLQLAGLQFREGDLAKFEPDQAVHLAISLHACDTATDDALAAAIRWKSPVILAVPCCQHELNRTIQNPALTGLLQYGLIKERFATLATDSLRALQLELHGYRTQVLEFIEMEHTPKNVLLRAVRRSEPTLSTVQRDYNELKRSLGISDFHLERVLAGGKPVA